MTDTVASPEEQRIDPDQVDMGLDEILQRYAAENAQVTTRAVLAEGKLAAYERHREAMGQALRDAHSAINAQDEVIQQQSSLIEKLQRDLKEARSAKRASSRRKSATPTNKE